MRFYLSVLSLLLFTQVFLFGEAVAAVSVGFVGNRTVSENDGSIVISLRRTGDLSVTTTILYLEDWNSATLDRSELLFIPQAAENNIIYNRAEDVSYAIATFNPGVSNVYIPYSIPNDQKVEDTEYVEFRIISVTSSSGTTSIGSNKMRITIEDDDKAVALPYVGIYPGTVTDEGNSTRSFVVLSTPATQKVTLRVTTNRYIYLEANYPNGGDYQETFSQLITVPAGSDFAWVPIQTYQNDDPNDKEFESFQLCIDSTSVSGAIINMPCAKLTIKDIPKAPAPVANASSAIFEDTFGNGWVNSSWGVAIKTGTVRYDGAYGIEANFTYPWAGLSFSTNSFNTAGFDTLSLAAKGSNTNNGSEVLAVVYLSNGKVNNVSLSNYIAGGTLATDKWKVIHIPLGDLAAKNAVIKQIVFENGAAGTIFIDDLSFLTNTGVCQ